MAKTATKPKVSTGVMDVSKPGKSAPSANSKGVIINHRPIMNDPMVVPIPVGGAEDDAASGASTARPDTRSTSSGSSGSKSRIQPLTAPVIEADAKKAENEPVPPAAPEPEAVPAQPLTPPQPAEAPIEPPAETPTEPAKAPEEPAAPAPDEADGEKKEVDPTDPLSDPAEAEAAEQAKHDEEIEKLIDSKQYLLPIQTVESRKARRFILLGVALSLVLAVAWADIALDAGLIEISNVKPVTHFFSN